MSTQRYSVTPHPIETLLTWVKSGEIAIPEIQRPFVWNATKVRNFLDSLYQGYPVGYLIAWRSPTVRLKDGSHSAGKRILIDGQQRVTALMAALLGDLGFLSRDIRVLDLLLNSSDLHHLYPRNFLKKQGLPSRQYNQIANYALTQSEINIAIGDKAPEIYFKELAEQCVGGPKKYGGIADRDELRDNLRASCLPESMLDGEVPAYLDFLDQRRRLMAGKIKTWFEAL